MSNLRFKIFLEKHVYESYKRINTEDVKPNKNGEIQEASDIFFIRDFKKISFSYYFVYTFFILLTYVCCYLGVFELFELESNKNLMYYSTILLFVLIIVFQAYYHFLGPDKKLILDRLNSLITLPRPYFLKPETISLKQLQAFKISKGVPDDYGGGNIYVDLYLTGKYSECKLKINTQNTDIHVTQRESLDSTEVESYWRFIVWYMDKNRPLPKGTAFDNYRNKDFERRKGEGFPPPLHN